jgi:hypothetical protein
VFHCLGDFLGWGVAPVKGHGASDWHYQGHCFLHRGCPALDYFQHSLEEIAAQRVYQIAAGYEDANDSNLLRNDTILKMSAGRLPIAGKPLASQVSSLNPIQRKPR